MAEYCCLARGDDCSKGLVEEIISGKEFFNSKWYEKIVDRSLVWDNIMLESCITILSTGITSFTSAKELFQLGYWNKRKEWFISNFFISFIFNNYQIEKIPSIEDDSLSVEDIISIGLKNLHETNFYMRQKLENGRYVLRHEDFISWYFGNQLAMEIRGIYISPQYITIPNVMSETKSPAIKYFINGKHIQQLELVVVRNSDRLETHFEKFVGKDGVNKSNRAWAIVDILSDRTSPVLRSNQTLPLSHQYENHLYSFTKPNNTLWKGRAAIKKNVSVNFRAQAFSTLTPFTFINSQIVRRFSQIARKI